MGFFKDKYYNNPLELNRLLPEFTCGQVHEKTRFGEVYQGTFTTIEVEPYLSSYRAKIKLFWYCKLRVVSDQYQQTIVGDKQILKEDWELKIRLSRFCHQAGKQRIKIFGDDGDTIYITKRENPINLVIDEYGRYIGPSIRTYISQLTLPDAFIIR